MKKKITTRIEPGKEDRKAKQAWDERKQELTLIQFINGAEGNRVNIDLTDPYVLAEVDLYKSLHPEVTSDMEAVTAIYLEECKRRGW